MTIAYDVSGPDGAPPILLVRPLGGWRASWDGFAAALARELRVVVFDAPGTGESPGSPRRTTRAMARDALALLDELGIARAHVYGISLGGMVATWLAIDAPTRVDRLVLASTPASGRAFRHATRELASLSRALALPPAKAEAYLAGRVLSARFRRANAKELETIRSVAAARPASRRALASLVLAALAHDVRARAAAVGAETLVLAGTRDRLLSPATQRHFAGVLPHGTFDAIDAGHDVSAEAPEAAAARVLAHVARS